jgi:hypothetical protein
MYQLQASTVLLVAPNEREGTDTLREIQRRLYVEAIAACHCT